MAKHRSKSDNSFKRIVIILLTIILIFGIILFIKIRLTEHIENEMQREVSKVLDTIDVPDDDSTPTPTITERMLKVKELQKENVDIVGWLEIEGTNINYPVLQGDDNDYYLKHNYKHEYISTGSIFLDKDYDCAIFTGGEERFELLAGFNLVENNLFNDNITGIINEENIYA